MTSTTWNRRLKITALTVTQFAVLMALAAAFATFALGSFPGAEWLVLLAAAELALASYAVAHLGGRARSALRGPTGYVCRHCGTDMTVSLCAMGHTHEAITVGPGGAS